MKQIHDIIKQAKERAELRFREEYEGWIALNQIHPIASKIGFTMGNIFIPIFGTPDHNPSGVLFHSIEVKTTRNLDKLTNFKAIKERILNEYLTEEIQMLLTEQIDPRFEMEIPLLHSNAVQTDLWNPHVSVKFTGNATAVAQTEPPKNEPKATYEPLPPTIENFLAYYSQPMTEKIITSHLRNLLVNNYPDKSVLIPDIFGDIISIKFAGPYTQVQLKDRLRDFTEAEEKKRVQSIKAS